MSNRRNATRGISGPQSALTDFLASHNISARQIRDTFEQRRANAQAANGDEDVDDSEAEAALAEQIVEENERAEAEAASSRSARPQKRKRESNVKAKEKAKAKKKAKKDSDSGSEFDSDFGNDMYKKSKPVPGQLENCDICNKRFTVTPYSKEGPDGGLLCTPCGKQITKENKAAEAKARKAAGTGKKRRQVESKRLDGDVRLGSKSLVDICIERVARHSDDVEELGDLPDELVDRLSQIFSKKRVLTSSNLPLFLRADLKSVSIHDAARLQENDFKHIFAIAPHVRKLVLRNAGQFKDAVMDYMIEKVPEINYLQIYGANLLTDEAWKRFFTKYGRSLETVKIQWTDASFEDETVRVMVANSPNLRRLKFKYCRKLTHECVQLVARLTKLEHLSLKLSTSLDSHTLMPLISQLGPQLRTLSLEDCFDVGEATIDLIGAKCSKLSKLRLVNLENVTDACLKRLFSPKQGSNPSIVPPLTFLDLGSTRDVDHSNPDGPQDNPVGVADSSFIAIMEHSGSTLRHLDISSCRHISNGSFCDAFSPAMNQQRYGNIQSINVSFCAGVATNVIKGIFACCHNARRIIAFACFKIGDVVVPQGVALIGVPRAQDSIENIGESGVNLEDALSAMGTIISTAA